ncbi:uncharacterized protein [Misgurnus anguillicaudatus]|uniref:uncharacterized protein n=1 Tax=Misgurnus anguillicaudatus TaxID=75329 RepID=UPI003CCF874F
MTRTLDLFSDDSLPETSLTNVSPLHQAVSDLLVNEPENTTEEATKNYRTKVLQKLQELAENQRELLSIQQRILAALAPNVDTDEELLDGPCQTLEAFVQFDATLESREKKKKMINYIRSLGGANPGSAVRKILRKLASTEVLSAYSMKGRKGKLAFQRLRMCPLIIEATQKNYKALKAIDVEDLIALALKFAPHRNLKCLPHNHTMDKDMVS